MNQYTIYCSPEQTINAFELGAPIQYASIIDIRLERYVCIDDECYTIPTTDQMIGWLEETYDLHINIDYRRNYADDADGNIVDEWYYYCFFLSIADNCFYGEDTLDEYVSREEATLAAIDAALEYLTKNKK